MAVQKEKKNIRNNGDCHLFPASIEVSHLFMFLNIVIGNCLLLLIYVFLTPNSRSVFRAGVSLNIHSFFHSFFFSV